MYVFHGVNACFLFTLTTVIRERDGAPDDGKMDLGNLYKGLFSYGSKSMPKYCFFVDNRFTLLFQREKYVFPVLLLCDERQTMA